MRRCGCGGAAAKRGASTLLPAMAARRRRGEAARRGSGLYTRLHAVNIESIDCSCLHACASLKSIGCSRLNVHAERAMVAYLGEGGRNCGGPSRKHF